MLINSWNEDALDTLKIIFQMRDCRGGKGEKANFIKCLKWLMEAHPDTLEKNLVYPYLQYWLTHLSPGICHSLAAGVTCLCWWTLLSRKRRCKYLRTNWKRIWSCWKLLRQTRAGTPRRTSLWLPNGLPQRVASTAKQVNFLQVMHLPISCKTCQAVVPKIKEGLLFVPKDVPCTVEGIFASCWNQDVCNEVERNFLC